MENKEPEVLEEKRNWADYIHEMINCKTEDNPHLLEDLFMEEHPLLPGEKESYDWLVERLGKENIGVELDETGYHVVRKKIKVQSK